MLQVVFILAQITIYWYYIYDNDKYGEKQAISHLLYQLTIFVFPIFYILIPSAFIIYRHYNVFSEDEKMINKCYR